MAQSSRTKELYDLIEGIEIAMLTTRRSDGRLVSRPMATQARADGADFWFATEDAAGMVDELEQDPNVNLAYYDQKSREYVSVSGKAHLSREREKIHELYRPDWKGWLGGDSESSGTPDDPHIVLIGVDAESAVYMKVDKPRPVVLLELVKGMVTGERAEIGETKHVSGEEISRH